MFGQLICLAQKVTRQSDNWDSLQIRTIEQLKKYEIILGKELYSIDTIKTKGQTVITYFAANKRILQKVSNSLDSNNCIRGIFSEYYNEVGLVAFRRGYKKCCPGEDTDDYKCFERITDYDRFEYDLQNRVIVRVFHVTTPMTYKETFTYEQDGTKQVTRIKITETSFWE